jgi:hypothetical protein
MVLLLLIHLFFNRLFQWPPLAHSFFCDLRTRKIKKTFFTLIKTLLDWKKNKFINRHSLPKRGKCYRKTELRWFDLV